MWDAQCYAPEIPSQRCVSTRTLRLALDRFHDLLRAVLEIVGGDHVNIGGVDDLLALFDVRPFQAHNQWNLETHLFHGRDNAFRDHVAAHDTAEDVDQDALDLRIRCDDLERPVTFSLVAPPPTS